MAAMIRTSRFVLVTCHLNPLRCPRRPPVSQTVSDPVSDPGSQTVSDPVSDPVSQTVSDPVSDPVSQTVCDPVSETVCDTGICAATRPTGSADARGLPAECGGRLSGTNTWRKRTRLATPGT